MTHETLLLTLNQSQANQLCQWCASYRVHAWHRLEPTLERNQIMKVAQAVQGRLAALRAGGVESLWLMVSEEEKQGLRQMISTLMQVSGAGPACEERNRTLGDLASLRMHIERAGHQTQTWETERRQTNLWQR